jgi:hypothetical protein
MISDKQTVYFLFEKNAPNFKIGIAKNVLGRARCLREEIDLERSIYVECATISARKIEQTIHVLFNDRRVSKDPGEGCTEWFDAACFDEAKSFVEANRERLGVSEWKPIIADSPVPKPKAPTTDRTSPRQLWDQTLADATVHNQATQQTLVRMTDEIRRYCFGRVRLEGASFGTMLAMFTLSSDVWSDPQDVHQPTFDSNDYFLFPNTPDALGRWDELHVSHLYLILPEDAAFNWIHAPKPKKDATSAGVDGHPAAGAGGAPLCTCNVFTDVSSLTLVSVIARSFKLAIEIEAHPILRILQQALDTVNELPSGALREELIEATSKDREHIISFCTNPEYRAAYRPPATTDGRRRRRVAKTSEDNEMA